MTRTLASFPLVILALAAAAGCGGKGSGSTAGTGATTGTGGNASASSSASTASGGGATSSSSSGGGATTTTSSTSSSGTTSTSTSSSSSGTVMGKAWPDTTAKIGVLADQLPNLTSGQQMFAATHFAGTQKQTLSQSMPLRAINPSFIVLHYHLCIWQSAPGVSFIVDGMTWGNDYPTVTTHESWFFHNQQNMRLASTADGKLLMNLNDAGFAAYWESSLEMQVAAGQYDGIFADSAAPSLLQGEVGNQDPRLAGTGAKDSPIAEWGGKTYIQVWETWIKQLNDDLAAKGIPLIPNTGPFVTTWDDTDYSLTAGIFSEGYADPSFAESDWQASTNELLSLAAKGKIMILQNYLGSPNDVAKRMYYLGNYLLVKGNRTYLDYFASGPLEWYPEWTIDLGAPTTTGTTIADLLKNGVYRRDFAKGTVLVNPSASAVMVNLGATMQQVTPMGGGAIDNAGDTPGTLGMKAVTSVSVPATGAVILLQ